MKKRGQVTIFIIVGIILVAVIGSFFAIRSFIQSKELEEARPVVESVPSELQPFKIFTEDCLRTVAEQGLTLLGQQGGRIFTDEYVFKEPTDSDGILFGDTPILYWHFNKEPNANHKIIFASNKPSVAQMEADLSRYVKEQMPVCLNGYKLFEGFDVQEFDYEATPVSIFPGKIDFQVVHPIEVRKQNFKGELTQFFTSIPLDLLQMWTVASNISQAQQQFSFLEKNLLSSIELASGVNSDLLPPMTDSGFDAAPVTWTVPKVTDDLKKLISRDSQFLRLSSSADFFRYDFSQDSADSLALVKQAHYDNYVIPVSGANNFDADFIYLPVWDTYNTYNAEADTIMPTSIRVRYKFFSFNNQRYKTVYGISYPLIVSLKDSKAFNNRGFEFKFGLEANIRENKPVTPNQVIGPLQTAFSSSLLCDESKRNSGLVTVSVRDRYAHQPITDMPIKYLLGDETCDLGRTDKNGVFVGKLPTAIGGVVQAARDDYLAASVPIDPVIGQEESLSLSLWKFREVSISALKKKLIKCVRLGNCYLSSDQATFVEDFNPFTAARIEDPSMSNFVVGWNFQDVAYSLKDYETVAVVAERVGDVPYIIAGEVKKDVPGVLRLVPGTYKLTVTDTQDVEVFIPASTNFKEVILDPFIGGGLQGFEWNLLPEELYGANQILFNFVEVALTDVPEIDRDFVDLEQLSKIQNFSSKYSKELRPTLI